MPILFWFSAGQNLLMVKEKYKLRVNEKFDFELTPSDAAALDIVGSNEGFHVLDNGKSYHAEVISLEKEEKKVLLKLNGQQFMINVADNYDQLVEKMGLSIAVIHKISEIKAPMPGLVLSIAVKPGQEIVHGDPLLILEAMKMENIIKSPGEGVVKTVHAIKGKAVEKGETLIELE